MYIYIYLIKEKKNMYLITFKYLTTRIYCFQIGNIPRKKLCKMLNESF